MAWSIPSTSSLKVAHRVGPTSPALKTAAASSTTAARLTHPSLTTGHLVLSTKPSSGTSSLVILAPAPLVAFTLSRCQASSQMAVWICRTATATAMLNRVETQISAPKWTSWEPSKRSLWPRHTLVIRLAIVITPQDATAEAHPWIAWIYWTKTATVLVPSISLTRQGLSMWESTSCKTNTEATPWADSWRYWPKTASSSCLAKIIITLT